MHMPPNVTESYKRVEARYSRKKMLLRLIDGAKREETRRKRLDEAVARAAEERFD